MMPIRSALNWLSPAEQRARLTVLIFHRVTPTVDPLFPQEMDSGRFDSLCSWLKAWFNVLPLDLAADQLRTGCLPQRACCITFDDGYADNLQVATPILRKHGLCATFFVATGFLDGGRMWNDTVIEAIRNCTAQQLSLGELGMYPLASVTDRRSAIDSLIGKIKYMAIDERLVMTENIARQANVEPPDNLMMTSDEVRALRSNGMLIGAHTVTHPILARLAREQACNEIRDGQRQLQDLLGERVGLFAYPNGKPGEDYLPEHVEIVAELGFDAGVSTAWGAASARTDLFQIPRFTPWDRSRSRFGLRLLRNMRQWQ